MGFLGRLFSRDSGVKSFLGLPPEALTGAPVRLDIVGEAQYQALLLALAGPKTEDSKRVPIVVDLTAEPSNPYDQNAVAARVSGQIVGYLDREQAVGFREMFQHYDVNPSRGAIAGLQGIIVGGWRRSRDDEGSFGVILLVPSNVARWLDGHAPPEVVLPRGLVILDEGAAIGCLQFDVIGEGKHQHTIHHIVSSVTRTPTESVSFWCQASLVADPANNDVHCRIAGVPVGTLPKPVARRLLQASAFEELYVTAQIRGGELRDDGYPNMFGVFLFAPQELAVLMSRPASTNKT
jgi:hypothetical protein